MKNLSSVRLLYAVAAAYDGLLGLAFLAAGPRIYAACAIPEPNHWGYVHFAAGILVIFGYMFLRISLQPVENRNLVPYGVLLKACYVATVIWYTVHGGIPPLWKWFAGADTLFALGFIWSLGVLNAAFRAAPPREASA